MFSAARRTIENAHQDVVTQKGRRSNLLCRPFDVWVATQLRERSERNKNPPAMWVEDKKLYKKHLSRLY